MDIKRVDTGIRMWVVAALAGGGALILSNRPLPTAVGVVLVILGLLSFMAVVRNGMVEQTTG